MQLAAMMFFIGFVDLIAETQQVCISEEIEQKFGRIHWAPTFLVFQQEVHLSVIYLSFFAPTSFFVQFDEYYD